MAIIRITKEFRFEMAHALQGYDGACKQIHGHSYELLVTIIGTPISSQNPKKGMVMDFGDLKQIVRTKIIDVFDHALVISKETPAKMINTADEMFSKLIVVDYQPTSENMIVDFASIIKPLLPKGVDLYSLKLRETATSYAEWFASDNE
jgi:6-pyruvoyltetrahydropterin/6-carboxytetrahydropterin synthase